MIMLHGEKMLPERDPRTRVRLPPQQVRRGGRQPDQRGSPTSRSPLILPRRAVSRTPILLKHDQIARVVNSQVVVFKRDATVRFVLLGFPPSVASRKYVHKVVGSFGGLSR